MMNKAVILLIKECAEEKSLIRDWLEKNNFLTRETDNVFDALEEMADYTMSHCPDVFLLSVDSPVKDFDKISETIRIYSDSEEISIITLPAKKNTDTKTESANQTFRTEANLSGLLPALSRAASSKTL